MGKRTYRDVARVYLDMDGPLANFVGAYEAQGLDAKHFKRVAGAFLNLPVTTGALEAVKAIESMGLDVFILSKIPGANPYAATEKILWIQRYLPHLADRVIISPDKGAVGTSRDFLVDDHPEWANAKNFPGQIILFEGRWTPVLQKIQSSLLAAK